MARKRSLAEATTNFEEARRDLVVIGASAGGLPALRALVSQLPADFPAAILIVMHIGSQPSILPSLLAVWGKMPAAHVQGGEPLLPGRVYVAPPDHHMLISDGAIRLWRGPKEHYTRPAIDPLFRSAAICCGRRAVGIILSGHMDDGTAGLQAIKSCGGIAVVQDPRDAQVPGMPMSALHHVDIDHCVPITGMAPLLASLVAEPVASEDVPVPSYLSSEDAVFGGQPAEDVMESLNSIAEPSTLVCTDCGGVLWEVRNSRPIRFRCHTGHAFTLRSLAASMKESTELALQSAIRSLQEQAILLHRAAAVSRASDAVVEADAIEADADRLEAHVRQLEELNRASAVRSLEPASPDAQGAHDLPPVSEQE
jgi:two-component system chemotaxis response regulator CheB